MRLFFLSMMCLLFCCCEKDASTTQGDGNQLPGTLIKVMSYNIYGARSSGGNTPADLKLLANVINRQKPDLVALNEIDVYTRRTGINVHQAKELAALTGMEYFFVKAIDREGGEYGDAVLSRLPILERKGYNLPVTTHLSGEIRAVARLKVEKEGKIFYFASTHLDHLASEDNRLLQADELFVLFEKEQTPIILAGDFNAKPDSETMKKIFSFMSWGDKKLSQLTFPSSAPNCTIDYILHRPTSAFYIQNYQVINEQLASDHRPVVAILRIL